LNVYYCDALKAVNLLKSLRHFILSLRDSNEFYENKITQLSQNVCETYKNETERTRKKSILMILVIVKQKLYIKEKTK